MRILYNVDDIFLLPQGPDRAVCVTTNGMVRKNGYAVMGRGIAKEADMRFVLAPDLGRRLKEHGNHAFDLGFRTDVDTGSQVRILTLPTKNDWRYRSDLALIEQSLKEIVKICDDAGITTCYLPRPGCANGGLDWERHVRPLCERLLDDRFVVADRWLKGGED